MASTHSSLNFAASNDVTSHLDGGDTLARSRRVTVPNLSFQLDSVRTVPNRQNMHHVVEVGSLATSFRTLPMASFRTHMP